MKKFPFKKIDQELMIPFNEEDLIKIIKETDGSPVCVGGSTNVYNLLLKKDINEYFIDMKEIKHIKDNYLFGAGLTLEEVENYLLKEGLSLPIKIMSFRRATLGGSFATWISGYGSYKYGFFNDNVLGYNLISKEGDKIFKKNNRKILFEDIKKKKKDSFYGVISEISLKPIKKKKISAKCYLMSNLELESILKGKNKSIITIMLFGKNTLQGMNFNKRFVLIESEKEIKGNFEPLDSFFTKVMIHGKFGLPSTLPKRVELGGAIKDYSKLFEILDNLEKEVDTNYVVNFHKNFAILNILFTKRDIDEKSKLSWLKNKKNLLNKYPIYPYKFGDIFSKDTSQI